MPRRRSSAIVRSHDGTPRVWDEGVGRYTAPGLPPDDPVEVGRYLDAFKRSRRLIAAIVVLFTAAVFVISLLLPKTYQATSKLVLNPSAQSLATSEPQSTQRDLATVRVLLTTRELLAAAAKGGLAGNTADSLRDKVTVSVDQDANVINIVGTDDRARGAAVIANGVAATFLARERRQQQRQLKSTRNLLNQEISDLQASSTPLNATAIASQIATVRQQLVDLTLATNQGPALELAGACATAQLAELARARSGTRSSGSSRASSSPRWSSSPGPSSGHG